MKPRHRAASSVPITLEIEKLVYGGDALARREGVTYFVPFVLPGETVLARPIDPRKNFVRAKLAEIVQASPERIVPPCPYFTVCGGCHYQHTSYEHQLKLKREILRETLARLGRVSWDGAITLHPSPPFGYRNRAQWKVRPGKAGAGGNRTLRLGYFRAGSTDLCAVDHCALLAPPLARALTALKTEFESGALPSTIRTIEVFAEPSGSLLTNVALAPLNAPKRVAQQLRAAVPEIRSLLLQDTANERMELDGPGSLSYSAGGFNYRVGHMSFFQVNRFLIEEMINAVASLPGGGLALDLFAGVGLFSVPLMQRFKHVLAVEADPAAARDLEANVKAQRGEAKAVNADAAQFLSDWKERPDLAVLDPPRSGVPTEALKALARIGPPRIVYFSCDPATLARDLRELVAAGYEIAELELFDAFPQTYHIETFVRLTLKP